MKLKTVVDGFKFEVDVEVHDLDSLFWYVHGSPLNRYDIVKTDGGFELRKNSFHKVVTVSGFPEGAIPTEETFKEIAKQVVAKIERDAEKEAINIIRELDHIYRILGKKRMSFYWRTLLEEAIIGALIGTVVGLVFDPAGTLVYAFGGFTGGIGFNWWTSRKESVTEWYLRRW